MKLLVLALVHIVSVYGGQLAYEAPFEALGVPIPHPSIPGATTTYHGNGRFIGFQPRAENLIAVQAPLVRSNVVPASVVPIVQAQHVIRQPEAFFHHQPVQPLVTKTIVPAQPIVQTHAVFLDQPVQSFKTSKFQVRRPAIQKQFYDIEERVIIRPAGSAVVELEPPHAKIHQGTILTPSIPVIGGLIQHDQQITSPVPENNQQEVQQQQQQQHQTTQNQPQQQENTDDSITVEAASRNQNDISYVRNQNVNTNIQNNIPQLSENQRLYIHQLLGEMMPQQLLNPENQLSFRYQTSTESTSTEQQTSQEMTTQKQNLEQSTEMTTTESTDKQEQQVQQNQQQLFKQSNNNVDVRHNTLQEQIARNVGSNEVNQRFIDLFTARQGITEIKNDNILQKTNNQVDNTLVRARIISADLNQNNNDLAKNSNNLPQEKVNTRRIVVARPIETIQEVHVVEPVTKVHRVHIQQPALLKSAHLQLQPGFYH